MKTYQYIIIALIVFLMSALSQVVVKEYLSTEPRIVRDTITLTPDRITDTITILRYQPIHTVSLREKVIHRDSLIHIYLPGDTTYITRSIIDTVDCHHIHVYQDSIIDDQFRMHYRTITHGRLLDFRYTSMELYPDIIERTIVRPPWLQVQGMAGAQISNTSIYPTVGIHANVRSIGAGFLSNGLGQTYFISYNKAL